MFVHNEMVLLKTWHFNSMSDTEKSTNKNIKQEIKQELLENCDLQNILEDNIDDALRTESLGLIGKY